MRRRIRAGSGNDRNAPTRNVGRNGHELGVLCVAQGWRFAGRSSDHKRSRAGANLQLAHALERGEVNLVVLVEWCRQRGRVAAQVGDGKSD